MRLLLQELLSCWDKVRTLVKKRVQQLSKTLPGMCGWTTDTFSLDAIYHEDSTTRHTEQTICYYKLIHHQKSGNRPRHADSGIWKRVHAALITVNLHPVLLLLSKGGLPVLKDTLCGTSKRLNVNRRKTRKPNSIQSLAGRKFTCVWYISAVSRYEERRLSVTLYIAGFTHIAQSGNQPSQAVNVTRRMPPSFPATIQCVGLAICSTFIE